MEVGPKMTATIDETCVDNTAVEAAVGEVTTSGLILNVMSGGNFNPNRSRTWVKIIMQCIVC